MNVTSGDTTKKLLFVAVDGTDFTSLETGLSSFTVYRTRDGGESFFGLPLPQGDADIDYYLTTLGH